MGLMADGVVAEVASPPERLAKGFADAIESWASAGRSQLDAVMPPALNLEPGSTHISVETHPTLNDSLCRLYTRTFAPGLMLLMDNTGSPGLLCRPRPGRAELCGEFVDGVRLRGAAAYAAGSVIALEQRLGGKRGELPPLLDVVVEPGRQRYGWYVDRRGFGTDLYGRGRQALLRSERGTIAAQEQLEASWEIAREALKPVASRADFAAADDLVSGRLALPCEERELDLPGGNGHAPNRNVFGSVCEIRRGHLRLEPVAATWEFVAYRVSDASRSAVVNVPESYLGTFVLLVEQGRLDDLLQGYLENAPSGRLLRSHHQTTQPGFFDDIEVSDSLLPVDRYGVGGGQVLRGRLTKTFVPPPGGEATRIAWPPTSWIPIRWPPRSWVPIGIGTGLIVTIVTGLIVFGGGGDSGVPGQPTTVVEAPSPTLPVIAIAPSPTSAGAPSTATPTAVAEVPTATPLAPTETPIPPTQAPPLVQTIETHSTNTLISYSPSCPQIFIDNNPPIGTVFDNVGSWTSTRVSETQATIQTAGGFNGTLDIPSRVMTGDRFEAGNVHYHKVLTWSPDFRTASGTTEIITNISGVDCVMTFEEVVSAPSPWLY
jgi:hypothetical protein